MNINIRGVKVSASVWDSGSSGSSVMSKVADFIKGFFKRKGPNESEIRQKTINNSTAQLQDLLEREFIPELQAYMASNESGSHGRPIDYTGELSLSLEIERQQNSLMLKAAEYVYFQEFEQVPRAISPEEFEKLVDWVEFRDIADSDHAEAVATIIADKIAVEGSNLRPFMVTRFQQFLDKHRPEFTSRFKEALDK